MIRYSYLWRSEHERGQDEGVKDRPCAIILVTAAADKEVLVTVLPVTHSPPKHHADAIKVPTATCRRLGLDDEPQWIVLAEANRFAWPGPDLRFGGVAARVEFGYLPQRFFADVRDRFLQRAQSSRPPITKRTD